MKDMPTEMPSGLTLAVITAREDPRDVVVSRDGGSLADQPRGARIGTSSLRRACQLRARRPDLAVVPVRGNVDTRLRKLDEGQVDVLVLAAAGLVRLGHGHRICETLSLSMSLPAIGQGALGLEARVGDDRVQQLIAPLHDDASARAVWSERAFLRHLRGGCQTPIAAHAALDGRGLTIEGLVGRIDGSEIVRGLLCDGGGDPESLGIRLAEDLMARGAGRILAEMRSSDDAGGVAWLLTPAGSS
jgi:hydroxymethylbilane synthase